jgi:hypothetical protein
MKQFVFGPVGALVGCVMLMWRETLFNSGSVTFGDQRRD